MRTTLDLPEELTGEVQARAGTATKTAAIVLAMQEYVARRRALEAFDAIRGKVTFEQAVLEDRRHAPKGLKLDDGGLDDRGLDDRAL